jgi:hypothetical protein
MTPPNYEGDSAKIISSGRSNTMQVLGDNVSLPYHHTRAQIVLANTSSPEDSDPYRHQARLTQENIKWSSTRPLQVEHRLHVRSPTFVVKLAALFTFLFHSLSVPCPGLVFYLHALMVCFIYYFDHS